MLNEEAANSPEDQQAPTLAQSAAHDPVLPCPEPRALKACPAASRDACSESDSKATDESSAPTKLHCVEAESSSFTGRCGTQVQSDCHLARASDLSATQIDLSRAHITGYEIDLELGRGGMGVVYKARDLKLNRQVALKTILGSACNDPRQVVRFMIEAEAVAAIRHPNVVQVFELGEVEGIPFMVMELVEGGSLSALLKAERKLRPRAAAALVAKVARGVEAAHASSIVHRDLKPQNILLVGPAPGCTDTGKPGEPKVTDFGIAKRGGGADLTQTNMVLGTPAYMSPEQAAGTKFVGPPSDVWSLGVILYECLAGVRPFPEDYGSGVLSAVLNHHPAPIAQATPEVPNDLELICQKCLEKEPADRYQTARELADDLERYLDGRTVLAHRRRVGARVYRWGKRNPVMAGLLLMVMLCGAGLAASLAVQYRQALQHKQDAEKSARQYEEMANMEKLRREESDRLHSEANAELVRANLVSGFLVNVFRTPDPLDFFGDSLLPQKWEHERKRTAEELLRDAYRRFNTELRDPSLSLVRARLLSSIGNSMKGLGLFTEAEAALREALDLRYQTLAEDNPDVLRSELDLGQLLTERGDYQAGIERFRKVLAIQKRIGASEAEVLTTRLYEGVALTFFGDVAAGPILREVVAGRQKLKGADHPDTMIAKFALVACHLEFRQEKPLISLLPSIRKGVKAQGAQFAPIAEMLVECQNAIMMAHAADQTSISTLVVMSRRMAKNGLLKSIRVGEERLPQNHYLLSFMRFELAVVLEKLGEDSDAEALFKRVLADTRETVSLAHPKAMVLVEHYTQRLAHQSRTAEARKLYEETDQALFSRFGGESHWRCLLYLSRAQFEARSHDHSKAFAFAIQALEQAQKGKLSHTRIASMQAYRTIELLSNVKADPEHQHVVVELFALNKQMMKTAFGAASEEMANLLTLEAHNRINRGDWAAASDLAKEAENVAAGLREPLEPFDAAMLKDSRGQVELARGQFAAAEECFRGAAARLSAGNDAFSRAEVAEHLAGALFRQNRFSEAVAALDDVRRFTTSRNAPEWELATADRLRAEVLAAAGDDKRRAEAVQAMLQRYGRSTRLETLTQLAWAAGLKPSTMHTDAADLAQRLSVALEKTPNAASGHRALALVRLRAGDWSGAEAALLKPAHADPIDAALRGLIAAALHDRAKAHHYLTSAESYLEQWKPSPDHPFAAGAATWHRHLEAELLVAELKKELAPRPVPPPPHEKVRASPQR